MLCHREQHTYFRLFSRSTPLSSNTWASFSTGLALPGRDLRRVQFVPGRQLRNRLVALDRLKCHLGLELSRKPLRVLMMVRPLYRRTHLSRLCQEVGPPLRKGGLFCPRDALTRAREIGMMGYE